MVSGVYKPCAIVKAISSFAANNVAQVPVAEARTCLVFFPPSNRPDTSKIGECMTIEGNKSAEECYCNEKTYCNINSCIATGKDNKCKGSLKKAPFSCFVCKGVDECESLKLENTDPKKCGAKDFCQITEGRNGDGEIRILERKCVTEGKDMKDETLNQCYLIETREENGTNYDQMIYCICNRDRCNYQSCSATTDFQQFVKPISKTKYCHSWYKYYSREEDEAHTEDNKRQCYRCKGDCSQLTPVDCFFGHCYVKTGEARMETSVT